jgi:sigma54-dependent transcription regulator
MMAKQGRQGSQGLYDKLLVPRLENYASNHDLSEIDDCVEYLRTNYPEYRRQKIAALKSQVVRGVDFISRKGLQAKPELRLQVKECSDTREAVMHVSCLLIDGRLLSPAAPHLGAGP